MLGSCAGGGSSGVHVGSSLSVKVAVGISLQYSFANADCLSASVCDDKLAASVVVADVCKVIDPILLPVVLPVIKQLKVAGLRMQTPTFNRMMCWLPLAERSFLSCAPWEWDVGIWLMRNLWRMSVLVCLVSF